MPDDVSSSEVQVLIVLCIFSVSIIVKSLLIVISWFSILITNCSAVSDTALISLLVIVRSLGASDRHTDGHNLRGNMQPMTRGIMKPDRSRADLDQK